MPGDAVGPEQVFRQLQQAGMLENLLVDAPLSTRFHTQVHIQTDSPKGEPAMVEKRRDKVTFRGRAQRRAIQQLYELDAIGVYRGAGR